MNDLVPTWIRERVDAAAVKAASNEAENQRQLAEALRIQKDGPQFIEELLAEFEINTSALSKLKLQGKTVPLSLNPSTETGFQVSVSAPSNFPSQTYANFFYAKGDTTIRCWILNGGTHTFRLCVWGETVRAIWNADERPLTAKELAEAITKRLVAFVERN